MSPSSSPPPDAYPDNRGLPRSRIESATLEDGYGPPSIMTSNLPHLPEDRQTYSPTYRFLMDQGPLPSPHTSSAWQRTVQSSHALEHNTPSDFRPSRNQQQLAQSRRALQRNASPEYRSRPNEQQSAQSYHAPRPTAHTGYLPSSAQPQMAHLPHPLPHYAYAEHRPHALQHNLSAGYPIAQENQPANRRPYAPMYGPPVKEQRQAQLSFAPQDPPDSEHPVPEEIPFSNDFPPTNAFAPTGGYPPAPGFAPADGFPPSDYVWPFDDFPTLDYSSPDILAEVFNEYTKYPPSSH